MYVCRCMLYLNLSLVDIRRYTYTIYGCNGNVNLYSQIFYIYICMYLIGHTYTVYICTLIGPRDTSPTSCQWVDPIVLACGDTLRHSKR